ncbi:OLC1v1039225C1 [Oldenlandia corymbosa var. corymbosa]|uniref:OLC1v1039225C1 n=1 Tax=Oldenlandia corymbosa var. corymbosa TaxID=529605 RepID=A0AAV1D281_OLDCO|nr:OLC1v1039225C1 [Oldenlandia corymbosa var. corymbosa]
MTMEVISIVKGKTGGGRRKIKMEKIKKLRGLRTSLSKRKKTLFKKAAELKELCGAQAAVIIQYPTGTFKVSGNESEINSIIDEYLSIAGSSCSGVASSSASASIRGRDHEEFKGFSCASGTSSFLGRDHQSEVLEGSMAIDQWPSTNAGCQGLSFECGTSSSSVAGGASNFGQDHQILERTESVEEEIKDLTAVDLRPNHNADQGFVPIKYGEVLEDHDWMDELLTLLVEDDIETAPSNSLFPP